MTRRVEKTGPRASDVKVVCRSCGKTRWSHPSAYPDLKMQCKSCEMRARMAKKARHSTG